MGLLSWLYAERAKDYIYGPLQLDETIPGSTQTVIAPESAYLEVMLPSFRIVNVRKGLSRFYGTVHSEVALSHITGKQVSFSTIATPDGLKGVDPKNLDRVIALQARLLGPIPYRGGDVGIEAGLFSIKGADLAEPFLDLLQDLAGLAGTTFISAALPFAAPLTKGISLLTGSADTTVLEIGIATTLRQVSTGYYVAMRAEKGAVNLADLDLDPRDFRLINKNTRQPVADYPYLVLQLIASPQRDDWFMIPDLQASYTALKQAVRENRPEEVKELLAVFRRTALTCDDLLKADGAALADKVTKEVNEVIQPGVRAFNDLPALEEIGLYERVAVG